MTEQQLELLIAEAGSLPPLPVGTRWRVLHAAGEARMQQRERRQRYRRALIAVACAVLLLAAGTCELPEITSLRTIGRRCALSLYRPVEPAFAVLLSQNAGSSDFPEGTDKAVGEYELSDDSLHRLKERQQRLMNVH